MSAMKLDEKALEAGARKEAEIDGRDFDALGRADKKRYIDRLSDAICAYIEAATPPDVVGLVEKLKKAKWAITNGKKPDWDAAERAIEEAATALRLSAGGGVPEGWYCSAGERHTLLYTLRQDGWRKGKPVMVNDVTIRIENANGSQTPIEPIVRLIMDAVNASPTVEAGHVE